MFENQCKGTICMFMLELYTYGYIKYSQYLSCVYQEKVLVLSLNSK